jgi:hypothetical protein
MRLTDENNELKRRIVELERIPEKPAPELRQVGAVNYYFVGEKGPYCQLCYDGPRGKLVALTPVENWNDGLRRHCVVCNKYFYEKPMDQEPAIGIISDPNGWMGR